MFKRIMTWQSHIQSIADDDPVNICFVVTQASLSANTLAEVGTAAVHTSDLSEQEPLNIHQMSLRGNVVTNNNTAHLSLHPHRDFEHDLGQAQVQEENGMSVD